MLTKFAAAKKFMLDFIFPPQCIHCKSDGSFLCENCSENIDIKRIQTCPECDKPAPLGQFCNECKKDYMQLDGLLVGTQYSRNSVVQKLIKSLKYKYALDLIPYLGNILTTVAFHNLKPLPWNKHINFTNTRPHNIIAPIPLHYMRKWQRGFNQSEYLSLFVHEKLKIQNVNVLNRVKSTKMQSKLEKHARQENIQKAFSVDPHFKNEFSQKFDQKKTTVVLVDDVATTLCTLNECAKTIKEVFPCIQVIGLVVARA